MTATPTRALLPYPGLRPFEREEANTFFGRETQIDAMVDRLGAASPARGNREFGMREVLAGARGFA